MTFRWKLFLGLLLASAMSIALTYSVMNYKKDSESGTSITLPLSERSQSRSWELRKTSFLIDKRHPRIAIIIVWIAKDYPPWMDLFVESCKINQPSFDWMFFATVPSSKRPKNQSPNVIYFDDYTKEELEARFGERLGFSVRLNSIKLNDFKPVYGGIFADYLSGYTHWGWSDLDLFYGDLQSVICLEELNNYDIYTILGEDSPKLHLAGQFTIMKLSFVGNTFWTWPSFAFDVIHNNSGFRQYDEYGSSDGLYWKQYRSNEPKVKVVHSSKQFSGYVPGNFSYVWTNGHLLRYPKDDPDSEVEISSLEKWWNSEGQYKKREFPICGDDQFKDLKIHLKDLSCQGQICINTQNLTHSYILKEGELYELPTPSALHYKYNLEGAFYHIGPQKWSIDYKCNYVSTAKWVLNKAKSYAKDWKMDFICEDYDEATAKRVEVS
eukprot:TRINITY_DN3331_c0_g1_i2.p1 TRINITY_DN3331_c0_g1~~TRINITY_DN3331_c0_g1_i2.p1  ORF type:complete len:438 (+),score=54.35 TRINITY_DN3331_c0_g1_i2:79-1392(+)